MNRQFTKFSSCLFSFHLANKNFPIDSVSLKNIITLKNPRLIVFFTLRVFLIKTNIK